MVMKVLYQFLDEVHSQPPDFPLRERALKVDIPFFGDVKRSRVGIDHMDNDFLVVKPHPHLDVPRSRWVVLYHICEEFLDSKVEYIPDLVIERVLKGKFVRKVKDFFERLYRPCKCLLHYLAIHV